MAAEFDQLVIGGGIVGSFLALQLAERGDRVALLERGGNSLREMLPARPHIRLTHRLHVGCSQARNHVLGGNGYFWGGGLMRPPCTALAASVGLRESGAKSASEDLSVAFESVEQAFGIRRMPARRSLAGGDAATDRCEVAEICVLPGRRRNTSLPALRRLQSLPGCEILSNVDTIEPEARDSGDHAVTIDSMNVQYGDKKRSISAKTFVVAAGAIDTNLWVSAHAGQLGLTQLQSQMGTRMHDHFSVPLARIGLSSHPRLRELLAPRFAGGMVFGRHFELSCEQGWGASGFLHFQFDFDDVSPYREIKHLLSLRQRPATTMELARAAGSLFTHGPGLLSIAAERLIFRRLHLSDRLSVTATLDFESFPHPRQKLRWRGGEAEFSWTINEEDEATFVELCRKAKAILTEFARTYSMQVQSLFDWNDVDATRSHLHDSATDAFHLGGGLQMGLNGDGFVNRELRVAGTSNVYLISTAVFGRPGVANPTHTLLALAQRFACTHSNRTDR